MRVEQPVGIREKANEGIHSVGVQYRARGYDDVPAWGTGVRWWGFLDLYVVYAGLISALSFLSFQEVSKRYHPGWRFTLKTSAIPVIPDEVCDRGSNSREGQNGQHRRIRVWGLVGKKDMLGRTPGACARVCIQRWLLPVNG